jgi:hypothetical protein
MAQCGTGGNGKQNVLHVSSENFGAAESHNRDADIAAESSQLVRLNILQQAASVVIALANQQPALALSSGLATPEKWDWISLTCTFRQILIKLPHAHSFSGDRFPGS